MKPIKATKVICVSTIVIVSILSISFLVQIINPVRVASPVLMFIEDILRAPLIAYLLWGAYFGWIFVVPLAVTVTLFIRDRDFSVLYILTAVLSTLSLAVYVFWLTQFSGFCLMC